MAIGLYEVAFEIFFPSDLFSEAVFTPESSEAFDSSSIFTSSDEGSFESTDITNYFFFGRTYIVAAGFSK